LVACSSCTIWWWEITHHQIVHELHATKGWRLIRHDRKRHMATRLPPRTERGMLHRTIFVRNPELGASTPKWSRPAFAEPNLKAQMRHRERRRDIERAANLAQLAQP